MSRTAKSIALPLLGAVLLVIAGCTVPQGGPDAGARAYDPGNAAATRFRDSPLDGRTAVESAIELSEKYARLSDQTVTLRQENQRLASENENLRAQLTALDAKLKQTQKELTEANDLLVEMLTELNQWKSNILGFRGEMRQAAQAQLEALLKVLEILGGEVEAGVIGKRHAGTLTPDANDVAQVKDPAMLQEANGNGMQ